MTVRPRSRFQPALEALEDRCLLSTAPVALLTPYTTSVTSAVTPPNCSVSDAAHQMNVLYGMDGKVFAASQPTQADTSVPPPSQQAVLDAQLNLMLIPGPDADNHPTTVAEMSIRNHLFVTMPQNEALKSHITARMGGGVETPVVNVNDNVPTEMLNAQPDARNVLNWRTTRVLIASDATQPGSDTGHTVGRRDVALVQAIQDRGVPQGQLRVLQDRQITPQTVLRNVRELFAGTKANETLVIYLGGHGQYREGYWGGGFDHGPDGTPQWVLSPRDLFTTIQGFQGKQVILFVDSSLAGYFNEVAGRMAASRQLTKPIAVVSSTDADSFGLSRWNFVDPLIQSINGSLPMGTRNIDIQALTQYLERFLPAVAHGRPTISFLNGFDPRLVLSQVQNTPPAQNEFFGRSVQVGGFAAGVVEERGPGYRIRYSDGHEAWVLRDRISTGGNLAVGQHVEARWEDETDDARILEVSQRLYRVHYIGYNSDSDQWVPRDQIRLAAPANFRVGERVSVETRSNGWSEEQHEIIRTWTSPSGVVLYFVSDHGWRGASELSRTRPHPD